MPFLSNENDIHAKYGFKGAPQLWNIMKILCVFRCLSCCSIFYSGLKRNKKTKRFQTDDPSGECCQKTDLILCFYVPSRFPNGGRYIDSFSQFKSIITSKFTVKEHTILQLCIEMYLALKQYVLQCGKDMTLKKAPSKKGKSIFKTMTKTGLLSRGFSDTSVANNDEFLRQYKMIDQIVSVIQTSERYLNSQCLDIAEPVSDFFKVDIANSERIATLPVNPTPLTQIKKLNGASNEKLKTVVACQEARKRAKALTSSSKTPSKRMREEDYPSDTLSQILSDHKKELKEIEKELREMVKQIKDFALELSCPSP